MNSAKIYLFFLAVVVMLLSACGDGYQRRDIVIEGVVDVSAVREDIHGPVMVAVMRIENSDTSEEFAALNIEQILDHPGDTFVEYFSADSEDYHFNVDITESGLRPGDNIAVFAFVANNYSNGVIAPKFGDLIGIGMHNIIDKSPLVHEVKTGLNEINIKIDRQFVDFDAKISGNVENFEVSSPMDVYVVAYMAEDRMTTIDFSDDGLGFDGIIGYFQKKNVSPDQIDFLQYTLDIIPYIPYGTYDQNIEIINDISVFVWLDINRNGQVDDQDLVGYYANSEDTFKLKSRQNDLQVPASLDVPNQNYLTGIDINNFISLNGIVSDTSQDSEDLDTIRLKGSITLPEIAGGNDEAPTYIIIADADYTATMKEKPLDGLYYFNRISQAGDGDPTSFEFDITNSHLQAGDEVMIVGLWDRDNQGWYPAPTPGDYLGLYLDMENLTTTYKIKAGVNSGVHIDLTRQVFDFEKEVSGKMNIDINAYPDATATIIAYAGELNSLDMTQLNPDDIVGIKTVKSGEQSDDAYVMSILPYGHNLPIDNVCIYAMLDEESDGRPDKIGYHAPAREDSDDTEGLWPAILTLEAAYSDEQCDLTFFDSPLQVKQPSSKDPATPAKITCTFDLPPDVDSETAPVFAAVFKLSQTDISDLFTPANMLNQLKYLQKIPDGEKTFTIGKDAGFYRGDEILISVFWDRDYNACYPRPTIGDMCGYYNDVNNFSILTVKLEDQGVEKDGVVDYQFSPGIDERFELSRMYYDHQAALKFNINAVNGYVNPGDPLLIFAIQGDLEDMIHLEPGVGLSIDWQGVDLNHIVAYGQAEISSEGAASYQYELKLLPFLSSDIVQTSSETGDFDLIEKVFLFVVDEAPGIVNGIPDSGEYIGYYYRGLSWNLNGWESLFPGWRGIPQPINISNTTLNLPGQVFTPGRIPIEIP